VTIWGIGRRGPLSLLSIAGAVALAGCNAITGLGDLTIGGSGGSGAGGQGGSVSTGSGGGVDMEASTPPECMTNDECTRKATLDNPQAGGAVVQAVCLKPDGKCAQLLSDDCRTITGDYTNDDAILVGSLFATSPTGVNGATNSTATTNVQRQQGATLAIEEINDKGGIPAAPGGSGNSRPLVMISCDAFSNMLRSAGHLINDLHIQAIVGPNTSQDTIDLTTKMSVAAGTALVSPSAVASSIVDLADNDLTWLMVPTDVQRSPLMLDQIGVLEHQIETMRSTPTAAVTTVKLSIIYRNDALGIGTRVSLDPLVINGKPLADSTNLASYVKIEPYDPNAADQNAIVTRQVAFKPDIVVLAGTAEAVDKVLVPLEAQWPSTSPKPYYIMIDSNKVTSLLDATKSNMDLRLRIRGTGVTPGAASAPVLNAFNVDYLARYGFTPNNASIGTSYDATYAIAYALAAEVGQPLTGVNVAAGLRRLTTGATTIETGSQKVLSAFQHLSAGEMISARGTFGPFAWDRNGAILGGAIEIWCIGATSAGAAVFQSSGLSFDLETNVKSGTYVQCP
jgi:ABC-type branched-subunit amino acid transport system substrate-binding protein